jgi:hypothetical protein
MGMLILIQTNMGDKLSRLDLIRVFGTQVQVRPVLINLLAILTLVAIPLGVIVVGMYFAVLP